MRKSLHFCFIVVLLYGFSNLADASMEITVYGGMNLRKGLCLEMDNNIGNPYQYGGSSYNYNSNNCNSNYNSSYSNYGYQDSYSGGYMGPRRLGEKRPWIVGGDIIYRIPTMRGLGIGVRYQYMFVSENQNVLFFNLNPKLKAHRVSFLINYRHVLTGRSNGPFIGAILSLDIFRHAIISLQAGLSTLPFQDQQQWREPSGVNIQVGDQSNRYLPGGGLNIGTEFTASNWIGTGQVALEAGFKSSGFLMKIEAGYSLYSFYNLEASMYGGGFATRSPSELQVGTSININRGEPYRSGLDPRIPIPNMKADLSSFYIILGIGFTFEAS